MYTKLRYWKDNYSQSGLTDKRALEDYIECESREFVSSLRSELNGVLNGNYNPDALSALLGPHRASRHGSFEEWARLMLMWMAAYMKH